MTNKEINEKLNEISGRVNKELESFYKQLNDNLQKKKTEIKARDKSQVVERKPKVANIVGEIPEMNDIQREEAMSVVKDITQEIQSNKAQYGNIDLGDRGDDRGSLESGEGTGEVQLISIGRPFFFDELDKGIANVFKRVKKREYFDVEGLFRGVTRKKKEKGLKRKNYLYLMLDVSGSMGSYSYKGVPLVALFASYLPPMIKKYDGLFVEVDGDEVKDTEFRTLSRNKLSDKIKLSGGGGAQFELATNWVRKHIKDNNVTDPIVIMAFDGHENFDFPLIKNTFFMTTQYGTKNFEWNGLDKQGFPNADLGQKLIVVDVD